MSTTTELVDLVFRSAHTATQFTDRPVQDGLLRELYDVAKWGPTSVNCQPMRLVFVRTAEGKQRIKSALMPGNVEKTMAAPVVVVVATDRRFYEQLPKQFPAMSGARDMLAADPAFAYSTGFRNSRLQGAYLMLAARMLGLAVGPMSGFDPAKLNAELFPDGDWEANFLFNLGYGDAAGYRPRGPRLDFEVVARMA